MAVAPVRSRIGFRVVDALNAEWDRLAEGHHETVGEWGLRHPVLAACLDLPDVLQVARFDVDSVLRCLLVEQLESGDDLADRTVLQIMLGRVVLLALRDPYEDAGDYVSAMWCRIRTYLTAHADAFRAAGGPRGGRVADRAAQAAGDTAVA
ncbi:MAG TPA: hypothetical protein VF635_16115, partial [Propionibacteriaceae bacterium]